MQCVSDNTRLCFVNFDAVRQQGSFGFVSQLADDWYTVRDGISTNKLMPVLSAIGSDGQGGKSEPAQKMTDGQGLQPVV
jgi:hypothetical protein